MPIKAETQEKKRFRTLTFTLPPDAYERLIQETTRRKIAREPNALVSALLREALTRYFVLKPAKASDASPVHRDVRTAPIFRSR